MIVPLILCIFLSLLRTLFFSLHNSVHPADRYSIFGVWRVAIWD